MNMDRANGPTVYPISVNCRAVGPLHLKLLGNSQAVGLGYANHWPFGPEEYLHRYFQNLWCIKWLEAYLTN